MKYYLVIEATDKYFDWQNIMSSTETYETALYYPGPSVNYYLFWTLILDPYYARIHYPNLQPHKI